MGTVTQIMCKNSQVDDSSSNDDGDNDSNYDIHVSIQIVDQQKVLPKDSPPLFLRSVLVTAFKALGSACLLSLFLGQPHPRKGRGVDAVSVTMRSHWMLQRQQC